MAARKRIRNPQSQTAIVAAAERVVAREGAAHLTLDAVAREAGISKGGLLYNFPNKEALLEAMVAAMIARIDEQKREIEAALPEGPNRALRGALALQKEEVIDRRAGLAILAAGAENPCLLAPLRERLAELHADIAATSADPLMAYVVWLARDMLMMWDTLGLTPFEEQEVEALLARLGSMAGSNVAAAG